MNQQHDPKKPARLDWHRADIVAALRKAGWSLRRLSKHHGYASGTTLTTALDRPWPKGERLIAAALGVAPQDIWPSRYAQQPPHPSKDTTGGRRRRGTGRRAA